MRNIRQSTDNVVMKLLTTREVAERLGVSERRVRALISEGKLTAHRIGRDYAIEETAVRSVKIYGKPGRPSSKTRGGVKSEKAGRA